MEICAKRPMMVGVDRSYRIAILSLAAAGALWGLTVPLSKLSLDWLGAGWLAVARFSLAAPLLALVGRRARPRLRPALSLGRLRAGAGRRRARRGRRRLGGIADRRPARPRLGDAF